MLETSARHRSSAPRREAGQFPHRQGAGEGVPYEI